MSIKKQCETEPSDTTEVCEDSRTIFVFGTIDHDMAGKLLGGLHRLDDGQKPIRVVLYSTGGDVDAGFAMYDGIRHTEAPVVIDAFGAVQSMAVLVLQAATVRRLAPECRLLLHNGSASTGETSPANLRSLAHEVMLSHGRYCRLIAQRCGRSEEQVRNWCDAETFFGPDEAIKWGLADCQLQMHNPYPGQAKAKAKRK